MQCGHRAWTVPRSREEKAKPARLVFPSQEKCPNEKIKIPKKKKIKRKEKERCNSPHGAEEAKLQTDKIS